MSRERASRGRAVRFDLRKLVRRVGNRDGTTALRPSLSRHTRLLLLVIARHCPSRPATTPLPPSAPLQAPTASCPGGTAPRTTGPTARAPRSGGLVCGVSLVSEMCGQRKGEKRTHVAASASGASVPKEAVATAMASSNCVKKKTQRLLERKQTEKDCGARCLSRR